MTRSHLVLAANMTLSSSREWSSLKVWGNKLVKQVGYNKAKVAVARKLAMIMHKIWLNNDRFRPKAISRDERAALRGMSITNTQAAHG